MAKKKTKVCLKRPKGITLTNKNVNKVLGDCKKELRKRRKRTELMISERETELLKECKKPKEFKLQMEFNDKVFKCSTDNLKEAIMKFAPSVLKTRIKFRIEKDGKVCERMYDRVRGRLLFKQDIMLRVFIDKLIFK